MQRISEDFLIVALVIKTNGPAQRPDLRRNSQLPTPRRIRPTNLAGIIKLHENYTIPTRARKGIGRIPRIADNVFTPNALCGAHIGHHSLPILFVHQPWHFSFSNPFHFQITLQQCKLIGHPRVETGVVSHEGTRRPESILGLSAPRFKVTPIPKERKYDTTTGIAASTAAPPQNWEHTIPPVFSFSNAGTKRMSRDILAPTFGSPDDTYEHAGDAQLVGTTLARTGPGDQHELAVGKRLVEAELDVERIGHAVQHFRTSDQLPFLV